MPHIEMLPPKHPTVTIKLPDGSLDLYDWATTKTDYDIGIKLIDDRRRWLAHVMLGRTPEHAANYTFHNGQAFTRDLITFVVWVDGPKAASQAIGYEVFVTDTKNPNVGQVVHTVFFDKPIDLPIGRSTVTLERGCRLV